MLAGVFRAPNQRGLLPPASGDCVLWKCPLRPAGGGGLGSPWLRQPHRTGSARAGGGETRPGDVEFRGQARAGGEGEAGSGGPEERGPVPGISAHHKRHNGDARGAGRGVGAVS